MAGKYDNGRRTTYNNRENDRKNNERKNRYTGGYKYNNNNWRSTRNHVETAEEIAKDVEAIEKEIRIEIAEIVNLKNKF